MEKNIQVININPKLTAGLLIVIVVFLSLMLYAVPNILQWIATFPLLVLALIVLGISLYAWKSKDDSKYIKIGIFLAISGIIFDVYLPPYSACAFAPTGTEKMAIQQAGTSSFAEDTAVCSLFSQTGLNFNIIKGNVDGVLLMFLLPIMLMVTFTFLVLAVKINKKYWTTTIYSIILDVVIILSAGGQHYTQDFALTSASIVTYGVFPFILLFIATKLLGGEDGSGKN